MANAMFCSNCGNKLEDNANFCPKCGAKVAFIDPRDGKTYKTVKIGRQIWMAENLNYECEGSKVYNNDPANGEKYGRLYDWETAKKACPTGWHLPTKAECDELIATAGGEKIAGKHLKAKFSWNAFGNKSGNGLDTYGFSALAGGLGGENDNFQYVGIGSYFWSASECNSDCAYNLHVNFMHEQTRQGEMYKSSLYSVRCLQD